MRPESFNRAFMIGIILNLLIVVLQFTYGWIANSLALLADAAHNLSDVVALGLAWGAILLGQKKPSKQLTYGYRKASILAALLNALLLLAVTGGIIYEAIQRLQHPQPAATQTIIIVAGIALIINTLVALSFRRGHGDLNIKGAFLHMVGDAAISLGVIVAAAVMIQTGWLWLDPVVSIVIALLVLVSSWGLARDALHLAMDGVPAEIDQAAVQNYLSSLPGVTEVHDLHIWALGTTDIALTAHLVRPAATADDHLLTTISQALRTQFQITHITIQIECGDTAHPCAQAPATAL